MLCVTNFEVDDRQFIETLFDINSCELNELMASDWEYGTERAPFYLEKSVSHDYRDYNVIAHHWCGAEHWTVVVYREEFGPLAPITPWMDIEMPF